MMNDKAQLLDRYRDVLGEPPDESLFPVVETLDTVAAAIQVPPAASTATARALQAHASSEEPSTSVHPQSRRLAIIAVAMAVLLVVGGGACAMLPILWKAFAMAPRTERIVTRNLGTASNQSRTIDGFTVTIQRVYADASQIVIGYTVQGPPQRQFNNFMLFGTYEGKPGDAPLATLPRLTDATGHVFEPTTTTWGAGVEQGAGGYLLRYEPGNIDMDRTALRVRLEAGVLEAFEVVQPDMVLPPNAANCQPMGEGQSQLCDVLVRGPFAFDLVVPIVQSRVAEVNETIAANGHTVTLERVVVAPTGTQIIIRGVGPEAEVILQLGRDQYPLHMEGAIPTTWDADSPWIYSTSEVLIERHGTWRISVRPRSGEGSIQAEDTPWTFEFVIP